MGTRKLTKGLSAKNQKGFCVFADRIKSKFVRKPDFVIRALEIFERTYWRGLRCCVFQSLKQRKEACLLLQFLSDLQIPPDHIRVIFYCQKDSPIVGRWKQQLALDPRVLTVFRRVPNAASRSQKLLRSIGIDVVFPAGGGHRAMGGFLVLLRFAARMAERKTATVRY